MIVGGRERLEEGLVRRRQTGEEGGKKDHGSRIFRILDPNIWKLHSVIMHLRSQPSERKWQENENPGRTLSYFHLRCEGQKEEYRGKDLHGRRLMSQIMGCSCVFCSLYDL